MKSPFLTMTYPTRPLRLLMTAVLIAGLHLTPVLASSPEDIALPAPQTDKGMPLMQALKLRRSTREFLPGKLSPQLMANLLWAGFGINRPENDHRTAPSAMNSQEVDIYVALPDALYLYEPKPHRLKHMLAGDFRVRSTAQPFAKDAAAVLVFVANLPRLEKAKPDTRPFYAGIDTGCISQNVYLFCASEGLGTVVFDLDRPPLAAAMRLSPDQQIVLAQAIGFPRAPQAAKPSPNPQ